jgi:hypothetical protein
MSDNNDTYEPTEEWTDDRDEQATLVDDSKRAASDTDSRIDQGGSDEFADDRTTYDPTDDVGEQASLTTESVGGGQMDLTGEQATANVAWKDRDKDEKSREAALDLLADGSFHPKLIKAGFDVNSISAAEAINEMGPDVSHVLKVNDNLDDLTEFPGVGEATAGKIRETIPMLKKRNVNKHGIPGDDVTNRGVTDNSKAEVLDAFETATETETTATAEEIEFERLEAANNWRDDNEEHLHESDNRASKTVSIASTAPEGVLEDAGTQAQISQPQDKKYGQVELTDQERDRLEDREEWTWGEKGFHAMSSKAVLLEEGGTPWLDHYDPKLEPIEHVSAVEKSTDQAVQEGMKGPGETGMRDDSEKSDAEIAQDLDKAKGEQCRSTRDACEEGHEEACRSLLEDCGWSEDEIDDLLERTRQLGEEPSEVYDPTTEMDTGQSFEDWAREEEEEEPEPPSEPSDEELAELAPTETPTEMQPPAYRALKKAWTGYKLARQEAREAHDEAENYAEIINGIRAVHDQEPLDFDEIEEWSGGAVMPDPAEETFPAPDGGEETLQEAQEHGHASGVVQQTLDQIGDTYDPTEEF